MADHTYKAIAAAWTAFVVKTRALTWLLVSLLHLIFGSGLVVKTVAFSNAAVMAGQRRSDKLIAASQLFVCHVARLAQVARLPKAFVMGCLILAPAVIVTCKCCDRAYRITVVHARAVLQAPSEKDCSTWHDPEQWCSIHSTGVPLHSTPHSTPHSTLHFTGVPQHPCALPSSDLPLFLPAFEHLQQEVETTHSMIKPVYRLAC